MGALVFHTLLSMSLLAAGWYIFFVAKRNWRPSHEALIKHGIVILLSIFVSYVFYMYGAFGMRPNPLDHDHKPALAYPFAHSEAARAAILGYLIALASYFWYWDRRATFERADAAILALKNGGSAKNAETLSALRKLADRMEPPTLILILLLVFSVAVIEFPGILKAFDTRVGKDGSISFSVRDQAPSTDYDKRANPGAGGQNSASVIPVLSLLRGRIEKDIETICVLAALKVAYDQKTKSSQPRIDSHFNDFANLYAQCPVRSNSDSSDSKSADVPLPAAFWDEYSRNLGQIFEYKSLAETRTYAIIQCFANADDTWERRQLVRVLAAPILAARQRLEAALLKNDKTDLAKRLTEADNEVRIYVRSIADLANLESRIGIPADWNEDRKQDQNDDSKKAPEPCKNAVKFAQDLDNAFVKRNYSEHPSVSRHSNPQPLCPIELGNSEDAIFFLCKILRTDSDLPYERLAFAAFSYSLDQRKNATIILDRWLKARKEFAEKQSIPPESRNVRDDWLAFIVMNARTLIVRGMFDDQAREGTEFVQRREFEELQKMHVWADIDRLLENHAPFIEDFAGEQSNAAKTACASNAMRRIVVLLNILSDERHWKLYFSLSDRPSKVGEKFKKMGEMDALHANAMKWRLIEQCTREAKVQESPRVVDLVSIGLAETEAKYWLAKADFLESQDGRAYAFSTDTNQPTILRAKARDSLQASLAKLAELARLCNGKPPRDAVCDYTNTFDSDSLEMSQQLLNYQDDFLGRRERMEEALARLKEKTK